MNQLRHSKVFRCYDDIVSQMRVHMNIIRPKFQAVYDAFEREFAGMHGVHWTTERRSALSSCAVISG